MDDGVIVEAGPPAQVLESPREERTKRFLGLVHASTEEPGRVPAGAASGQPSGSGRGGRSRGTTSTARSRP